MHETFSSLLRDRAHWEFEIFLMLLFDGVIAGVFWPFVREHWNHHVKRDAEDDSEWGEYTEDGPRRYRFVNGVRWSIRADR